ncbi:MAG: cobalamin biosynthesis protein CobW, partial [Rhodobacteraceae bacterium]|nr:cobalamin biosynthesis protein CobW [Paracoccaceae bacterium]
MHKVPATVVTGFLGAGKTTLIRHLLTADPNRRIALIVNEFGDLGFDGELLAECGIEGCGEDGIVELTNGCICCTVAEEFTPAMEAILDRDPLPSHIVIETSGLALPQPLVRAFNWPSIKTRVSVDGVLVVVDGPAIESGQFAHDLEAVGRQRTADENLDHETPLSELFEDQMACADLIVVNKCDELSSSALKALRSKLRSDA